MKSAKRDQKSDSDQTTAKPIRKTKAIEHPAGWVVLPIHYSHDDDKDEEWMIAQRALYDREEDWSREMEMDFTAQLGAAAYPSFNFEVNTKEGIGYSRSTPLCVACDFNVDPCIFEICQIRGGMLVVIQEICMSPGSVPEMVQEFRNMYPAHPAEVHIYGDSNGHSRSAQSAKSDYDLMQLHFKGYPSRIQVRVPKAAPRSRDRVNSLNHKLKGVESAPGITIDRDNCPELIKDLQEVVLRPDGRDVLKIYADGNPYKNRTHASDAIGYMVYREWPIIREVARMKTKQKTRRAPMTYGKMLGALGD